MTTIRSLRLRTTVYCCLLTRDHTHLLISAKNGTIFVLAPERVQRKKSIPKGPAQ